MSLLNTIKNKIYSQKTLQPQIVSWKKSGKKIVFTNGCFDILHTGHIQLLVRAADLGDKLIVGLNSDQSIQDLKGIARPIQNESSRALSLASLSFVDAVILFSEETPYNLISLILPDILAKGDDYKTTEIAGHDIVQNNGGKVVLIPFIDGYSTTSIINKIKNI